MILSDRTTVQFPHLTALSRTTRCGYAGPAVHTRMGSTFAVPRKRLSATESPSRIGQNPAPSWQGILI